MSSGQAPELCENLATGTLFTETLNDRADLVSLFQRHMIEAIPVACVAYDFNGQRGSCWVVGLERVAYVPQYPKKCCIL